MSSRVLRLVAPLACTALLVAGLTPDAASASPRTAHRHAVKRHHVTPVKHRRAHRRPARSGGRVTAAKPPVPATPPPAEAGQPAPTQTAPPQAPPTTAAADPNLAAGGPSDLGNAEPAGPSDQLGAGPFANASIADIALSKVGLNLFTPGPVDHGQCKQAVNDWVAAASNNAVRLGGSYYNDYVRVGAQPIARDASAKGDIIQLSIPGSPNAYRLGMHTAVVVGHTGGSNTFDVVDSNSRNDDVVRHHAWDPFAQAAKYGLQVNVWRVGNVDQAPPVGPPPTVPTPTPTPAPPLPVFVHHVSGTCRDGACGLNVRSGPGYTSFPQVRVIPEGGEADVACQARGERVGNNYASSGVWDRLTDGTWVADFYLDTPNIDQWSPPIPQC